MDAIFSNFKCLLNYKVMYKVNITTDWEKKSLTFEQLFRSVRPTFDRVISHSKNSLRFLWSQHWKKGKIILTFVKQEVLPQLLSNL